MKNTNTKAKEKPDSLSIDPLFDHVNAMFNNEYYNVDDNDSQSHSTTDQSDLDLDLAILEEEIKQ